MVTKQQNKTLMDKLAELCMHQYQPQETRTQPSTTFMFSHLNDMFVNNNKHLHLNKQGNSYFSNTPVGIYLKIYGFDGTICTMGSNVCKQCNLHVNNNEVLHSTFTHNRTLLVGTTTQLCPSTNHVQISMTFL